MELWNRWHGGPQRDPKNGHDSLMRLSMIISELIT